MRAEGAATATELVESLLDRAERVVVGRRENLELVLLALLCPGSRLRLSDLPTSSRPRNRRAPATPSGILLLLPNAGPPPDGGARCERTRDVRALPVLSPP